MKITVDKAVIEQALEALEVFATAYSDGNEAITALHQAIEQAEQDKHVEHCEVGPEHCPVCLAETRSLALDAAIGYVQRHTPKLVSDEICRRLNSALNQIGDFAHDKSTGTAVPDALWEIREMAYSAMEDTSAPPRQPESENRGQSYYCQNCKRLSEELAELKAETDQLQQACRIMQALIFHDDQQAHKDAGAFIVKHGIGKENT